jgi:hypothetical protein
MSDNIEVTLSDMKLVEKCDYETKLAITAWVMENIVKHAEEGGSFRYLIYTRLGFNLDAYVPLYEAGGMTITNEFDLQLKDRLIEIVKENNYEKMKPFLGLCDEFGCYNKMSCGWPTLYGGYRNTCSKHYVKDVSKA